MGGYAGNLLDVDLTTGRIQIKPLDRVFARKHIGGLGFGTRIFLDLVKNKPRFDALSADNPFILMTGPLTGCGMDATARWSVCSKSPLTGYWGDANVGGHFGSRLKLAGYDGIVITGAAEQPVYLFINDQEVALRDASEYWGKDVYATTDGLTKNLRDQSAKPGQVLAIGPAGENRVRFANLINKKGHAAGRTGLGAVWGSKKLKAIYVAGSGNIDIAHPEKIKGLRAELKEIYDDSIYIHSIRLAGTPAHLDVGIISGDIPIKNWQMSDWEDIDKLGPASIEEKIHAGGRTCYGCTVACKKNARVKAGPYQTEKGPAPEYETVAAFGTMCLNPDIESVAKANDICNRYGLDTITCGATIAFAIDCFENGLLTTQETDGLELRWGNSAAIVALAEKIGKNEGFGAILAGGSVKAAKHIGKGADQYLTAVKGLEAPMHDPRNAHGFGLAFGVSPRGACHEASLVFEIEGGAMYIPELPALAEDLPEGSQGRARLNVACQDYGMFFSHCAIFCNLGAAPLTATHAVAMLNDVTGFDYTLEEVMAIGRRVWYLKRGLTNLFGARAKDDRLPARLMTPLREGPTKGSVPDMALMLKEFYQLRGLDEDGRPRKAVLKELGLADLADLLFPEK